MLACDVTNETNPKLSIDSGKQYQRISSSGPRTLKELLDMISADKGLAMESEILAMASRRVGRIAEYIDAYRHAITNRNEMNMVQVLLGKQCNILGNKRRIIRRGIITRRTSGWTSRKTEYIFFLFSDIFLWTSRKGKLKNAVYLVNCELELRDTTDISSRSFQIVMRMFVLLF